MSLFLKVRFLLGDVSLSFCLCLFLFDYDDYDLSWEQMIVHELRKMHNIKERKVKIMRFLNILISYVLHLLFIFIKVLVAK